MSPKGWLCLCPGRGALESITAGAHSFCPRVTSNGEPASRAFWVYCARELPFCPGTRDYTSAFGKAWCRRSLSLILPVYLLNFSTLYLVLWNLEPRPSNVSSGYLLFQISGRVFLSVFSIHMSQITFLQNCCCCEQYNNTTITFL